jgi:hypothetical protein
MMGAVIMGVSGSMCASAGASLIEPVAGSPAAANGAAEAWRGEEKALLREQVQLTFPSGFVKAGEAYFDHQTPPRWIVFQAVKRVEGADAPSPFYAMFVAKLKYADGRIVGIEKTEQISPEGSANTCGWFHPTQPYTVMYGSTLKAPVKNEKPGFRVGTRSYVWQFPDEMEIVRQHVRTIAEDAGIEVLRMQSHKGLGRDGGAASDSTLWWTKSGDLLDKTQVFFDRPKYDAECSYSKDGRFVLYTHVRDDPTKDGKDDGDIWIYDTQTKKQHEIVRADGYDGGPFFSPDGKRICYRSDRKGDDVLQLFVADLKFVDGVPVGIEREIQITDDEHVNWAPYWHPSGRFLVYGSSGAGHTNYEVFVVEVPPIGAASVDAKTLKKRRITFTPGADILPVFSDDGKYMMWTSQRGAAAPGEAKPSSQVWVAEFASANAVDMLAADPSTHTK